MRSSRNGVDGLGSSESTSKPRVLLIQILFAPKMLRAVGGLVVGRLIPTVVRRWCIAIQIRVW